MGPGRRQRAQRPAQMTAPFIATDWLGYGAAVLTTLSFLPQALLTLRTRDVAGISLTMYSCFTAGVLLWLLYGLRLGEWPIVIANIVTLTLAGTILGTKLVVEWRTRRRAPRAGN